MSGERAVVRIPFRPSPQPRRGLIERAALGFPRLRSLGLMVWARLPPNSRLRRAIIHRSAQLGIAASERDDYEAMFMLYDPQCESTFPPQLPTVGTEGGTRTREDRVAFERRWRADWGEMRYAIEEISDLGDRVLLIGRIKVSGMSSGAGADTEWAVLYTTSPGGGIIREQVFFDHADAVEAAGISE